MLQSCNTQDNSIWNNSAIVFLFVAVLLCEGTWVCAQEDMRAEDRAQPGVLCHPPVHLDFLIIALGRVCSEWLGQALRLAWISLIWLGRLASDLSRAPLSSSQSWDYRGVPPCLAFYKGAATQTQVSLLSQQACYRQNHFYRHGSIFQQNTWGSHTCV